MFCDFCSVYLSFTGNLNHVWVGTGFTYPDFIGQSFFSRFCCCHHGIVCTLIQTWIQWWYLLEGRNLQISVRLICAKKHHIGCCPAHCFFRQRISIALCLGDLIFVTSKPSSFLNLLMTDASRWFYRHFQILTLLLPVYLRKQYADLLHHYTVDTTLGLVWFGFWFCGSKGFVSFGLIQLLVSVLWKVRSERVLLVALVCQGSLNSIFGRLLEWEE